MQALGCNVVVRAIFIRHAEKEFSPDDPETGLSERGRRTAAQFGRSLQSRTNLVVYAGTRERHIETGELILGNSPAQQKVGPIQDRRLTLYYSLDSDLSRRLIELKKLGIEVQTDYYLGIGDRRPDAWTCSPFEVASQIAEMVRSAVLGIEMIASDSEIDIFHVSSDFNIAAFLKFILGFDKIREIGGIIGFLDWFEIEIRTNQDGERLLVLNFRGKQYVILEKDIFFLADFYKIG